MNKLALTFLIPLMTQAASYSVRKTSVDGIEVVQLVDAARRTEVSIAPSIGNMAYEMKVNGKNAFWFPFRSPAELKEKPTLCGNPFLAPWANRIDQDAFWANGRKYLLNGDLGNLRRDPKNHPIHGVLNFNPAWKLVSAEADAKSAWATSRLEFWKHPEMMAQFPFAHTITMTYRLAGGVLEVETTLDNHSTDPMPVAVGYHPYFRLHDTPRDGWKAHLSAKDQVVLSPALIPTGERKPASFADPYPLAGTQLDDVFTNLVRGADGKAHFWVEGKKERVTVTYGPKYQVAVVYAPAGRDFICFEPMAAITNAFNLAHAGLYKELQSVAPGGQWKESFWISATGF
jgi:aldose 1-epimerase